MKTTIDKKQVIENLKKLGKTDEREIEFILQSLPSEDEPSEPKNVDGNVVASAAKARLEYGQGNPANPRSVYIRSLAEVTIAVEYSRTIEGGNTYLFTETVQPQERKFIGWTCETSPYTTLCERNITYSITRVAQ